MQKITLSAASAGRILQIRRRLRRPIFSTNFSGSKKFGGSGYLAGG